MKSKNLSEKILRSVKSKGFKYIDLPSVIEAIISFNDLGKILESLFFHSLIKMVVSFV